MQSAAECVSLIKWTVARYRGIEEKRVVHCLNKYARISVIGQWQRQFPAACVGSMHLILFYTLLEIYNIYSEYCVNKEDRSKWLHVDCSLVLRVPRFVTLVGYIFFI